MSYRRGECGHRWRPISGWIGRYRCRDCFVIAYRAGSQKLLRNSEALVLYRCQAKDCDRPVTRVIDCRRFCPTHARERGR